MCSPRHGNTGHVLARSALVTGLKKFNTLHSVTYIMIYSWFQSEQRRVLSDTIMLVEGPLTSGSLVRSFGLSQHPELLGEESLEVLEAVGFISRRQLLLGPQRKLLILGSQLHNPVLPVVTRPGLAAADVLRSSSMKSASLVLQWGSLWLSLE